MNSNNRQYNCKNKQGQLTVFIIVGLLIMIVTGLTMYMTSEMFKYPGLPDQFIPVAKYTEQCINDVALEGIFLAGLQGGYIYPEFEEDEAYLDAGFPVTYWFLGGEDRSVTLQRVEADLATFIRAELDACLNNYESFPSFSIVMNEEEIELGIDIKEKMVTIDANIHVEITEGTTIATLPELQIEVDNTIGNKIFLAYQIMKKENEEGFLEFYTNEIIAASDWLPYEGFDLTCQPRRWTIDEMQDYIERAIEVNLPFLMFKGTSYEKTGDPYYDNIYMVDVGASGVKDLNVRTTYSPRWGMELDVLPNKNGIVTDIKMVGQTVALPCVKVFHHKYSTYYPVLFEINDEDNSEYPFMFASPVIMTRNEPNRLTTMAPWPSETDAIRSAAFCAQETAATEYTLNQDGTITTQESSDPTWEYSLDIIAMDSQYGFDGILDDVDVEYQCVQFTCDIGTTEFGSGGVITTYPLLSTEFPSCLNGQLIANKEGYHTSRMFQSVNAATSGATINLEMHRLQLLDPVITVVQNHNNAISEREVEGEEIVVINIQNEEQDFEKVIVYPIEEDKNNDNEDESDPSISSAAGFDNLELLVTDDITYFVDIKLIEGDRYTGGFSYNWTPSANSISSATKAKFYVIKKDVVIMTDENYREAMEYAQEESANYPPELY